MIASVWGHEVDDFGVAAKMLRGVAAAGDIVAVEVNVSCPNLHHGAEMFAHDPDMTAAAVGAVVAADLGIPVFAKLSPNVTDLEPIAAAALDAGATGLTLVNTVPRPARSTRSNAARRSASARAAAGSRVPRSSRSRCARCTTSPAPTPACRSSAPGE